MNFEKLNLNQYTMLGILFMIGGTIVANVGSYTGTDVWILYLIAMVTGILVFMIYYRLLYLHGFRSFPLIFERCVGYWGGKFLCAAYAAFFLFRTSLIGDTLTEIASDILMKNAPIRLIMGILITGVVYGCHKGLRALGRSAEIMMPIILLCLIPFLVTAATSGAFTLKNLQPVLVGSASEFWSKTAAVAMYPYMETLLFSIFMVKINHQEQKGIFKHVIAILIIGTVILTGISLTNLAVLGRHLVTTLQYPFYNAMMLAGIHGVLERLDPLAVIIIIVCGFYKTSLYFYAYSEMFKSLFVKLPRNWILVITSIIIFIKGPNTELSYTKFLVQVLPFKILPWFHLVIPISLWLISEVKVYLHRKRKIEDVSVQL